MQPEFTAPEFLKNNSAEEIHQRMMNSLPDDIDDLPGGFPYDLTMPAALEKAELVGYHLERALMIAFPEFAWDDWLDLHGRQVHLSRHEAGRASGRVRISGIAGTEIAAGTVFCTPATDTGPAIEFVTEEDCVIGEDGKAEVPVTAAATGTDSNVKADMIAMMAKPVKGITAVTNPEPVTGGTAAESDNDFYDRIAAEYASSLTYVGSDSDYVRWAREAGAGDCIVVPAYDGPGTVKLILVDGNGQPANDKLLEAVYRHILSPDDRSARLLPTACAKLVCVAAAAIRISFTCTGLQLEETTNPDRVKAEFAEGIKPVFVKAKEEGILRYNDVRPILSGIGGVKDFEAFLMNGGTDNIRLKSEEYPETGLLEFSQEAVV